MQQQQSKPVTASPRLEALKAKHESISTRIETEQNRAFVRDWKLSELKREKLRIKEELEGVRTSH